MSMAEEAEVEEVVPIVGVGVEDITESGAPGRTLLVAYAPDDSVVTTLFALSLDVQSTGQQVPVAAGQATIAPDQDSDPLPLLRALAYAHEHASDEDVLRGARVHGAVAEPRTFDVSVLGEGLDVGEGGRRIAGFFTLDRPGAWTVLKWFVPRTAEDLARLTEAELEEVEEHSEVFFAFNIAESTGVFIVKDPSYWPGLERSLTEIL